MENLLHLMNSMHQDSNGATLMKNLKRSFPTEFKALQNFVETASRTNTLDHKRRRTEEDGFHKQNTSRTRFEQLDIGVIRLIASFLPSPKGPNQSFVWPLESYRSICRFEWFERFRDKVPIPPQNILLEGFNLENLLDFSAFVQDHPSFNVRRLELTLWSDFAGRNEASHRYETLLRLCPTIEEIKLAHDRNPNSYDEYSFDEDDSAPQCSGPVLGITSSLALNIGSVTRLELWNLSLDWESCVQLGEALRKSRTLKYLKICAVSFGTHEHLLLDALEDSDIEVLDFSPEVDDEWERLHCNGVQVSAEFVIGLCKFLESPYSTVQHLCLANNDNLGDASGIAVANMLESNTTLKSLDLRHTGLGNQTASALCRALSKNKTLEILYISGNRFDQNETKRLVQSFQQHHNSCNKRNARFIDVATPWITTERTW